MNNKDKYKDFNDFVRSRQTDCPVCYGRLADHSDADIATCFQMHNIFKDANGSNQEPA